MVEANRSFKFDIDGTAARKPQLDSYNYTEDDAALLRKFKEKKRNQRVKARLTALSLLFFLCCGTILIRYAIITEQSYSINRFNKQYDDLVNSNTTLKADIDKSLDLNKIKQMAEANLAMQKPSKNQVVYVSIPKVDYATVEKQNNLAFLSGLKAKITALFSKLY